MATNTKKTNAQPAPDQEARSPRRPKPAAAPLPAAAVAAGAPSFYPEFIFGLHESGGQQHMLAAGRPGWVLELAEVGLSGTGGNADFNNLAAAGIGVVVRLNHGYGSSGTLPLPAHYEPFAAACQTFVARSQGCHIWIVGNEPNHESERPNGQIITPADYAQAYTKCRDAIRSAAGHAQDHVLVAGPAPWNATTTYPGNANGDWVQYLADTLALLPAGGCDGLALHTYTHDLNIDQIRGDFFHGAAGYTHLHNEFRTYIDFMNAIPPRFRALPVLITETDPTTAGKGWEDGRNAGWVQEAYAEIARWNSDPAHQPIQALILYRWPSGSQTNQPEWAICDRQGIIDDFGQALAQPADRFRVRLAASSEQPEQRPVPLPQPNFMGPIPAIFTNQQLINAFFFAAETLESTDGDSLMTRAGLDLSALAQARTARYTGVLLEAMPALTPSETSAVRRELLGELLKTVRWVGIVNAPDGLNLRPAPDTQSTPLCLLSHETLVQVLDEQTQWLFVAADDAAGYVFAGHVVRRIDVTQPQPGPTPTPVTDYAPAADQLIVTAANASAPARMLARIWNRYGALIQTEAQRLGIDPSVAIAVLAAEAGGEGFATNGQMVIRFENHLFYEYWGQQNQAQFHQHFDFDTNTVWQGHQWRPDPNGDWQPCHLNATLDQGQAAEWQVFLFACQLDETAAILSISMGMAQIMGFNYQMVGFGTPQAMFASFKSDIGQQIGGFFRFVESRRLVNAIRTGDFVAFATGYNGAGWAEGYANLIRGNAATFQELRPAVPIAPAAMIAAAAPAPAAVPMPPSPTPGVSLKEADPALYAMWRKHIEQGFQHNEAMFQRVLNAFMNPYWTTVWMYRILFGVGIAGFLVAALLGIQGNLVATAIFAGLSVVSFLSYFVSRPLQALEENLQFITWLGIVYNTYWTRLANAQDAATFQTDLQDASDKAIAQIKELIDTHGERSGKRPGLT